MSCIVKKRLRHSFLPQVKIISMPNIQTVNGKMQIPSKCRNLLHNLNGQAYKSSFKAIITMKLLHKHRKRRVQLLHSYNNSQHRQRRPMKQVLHLTSCSNHSSPLAIQTMLIKEDGFLLLALQQGTNLTNSYLILDLLQFPILQVQLPKQSVFRSTKCLRILLYCKSQIQARAQPHTSIVHITCSHQIKTRVLSLCQWPTTTHPN